MVEVGGECGGKTVCGTRDGVKVHHRVLKLHLFSSSQLDLYNGFKKGRDLKAALLQYKI